MANWLKNNTRLGKIFAGLSIILALLIPQAVAQASNDFTIENGEITAYTGAGGSVTIPDGVTSIKTEAFFDKHITSLALPDSLTSIGDKAFDKNKITKISGGENLKTVGDAAFRGNQLKIVNLANIETIGNNSFENNQLETITLPATLKTVGANAFANNNIAEATIQSSTAKIADNAFTNNSEWVKVNLPKGATNVKNGTQGNSKIVVNPIKITYKYIGYNEASPDKKYTIQADQTVGTTPPLYSEGTQTITPPVLNNYQHEATDKNGQKLTGNTADLKEGDVITFTYMTKDKTPRMSVPTGLKVPYGQALTNEQLLKNATATSYKGKQLKVTVTPEKIEPGQPENSLVTVTYKTADEEGNTATQTRQVLIGTDWARVPVGGGWVVGDFTYDGETLIGFSAQGEAKLKAGKTELYIPKIGTEGQTIISIGYSSFSGKGLTAIKGDWNNITTIFGSAFKDNKLTSIPDSWGDIKSIEEWAFSSNQLASLPDSWGNITSVKGWVFRGNNLRSLPKSWDNITSVGNSAFIGNQLTFLPDSWGNVAKVESAAFANNQLIYITKSWGDIKTIEDEAFRNNKLVYLPESWGNITYIGYEAFFSNRLISLPKSWDSVTFIGTESFSRNQLTSFPDSWGNVTDIKGWAFAYNELTSLPKSWGNVKSLGAHAFYINKLTSLPDSWGNLITIGDSAFSHNKLTTLPDSWGNITNINNYVFENNQLTTLPDSWGEVVYIGKYAFDTNQLTTLPDSWGNIRSIREDAFSRNEFDSAYFSNHRYMGDKLSILEQFVDTDSNTNITEERFREGYKYKSKNKLEMYRDNNLIPIENCSEIPPPIAGYVNTGNKCSFENNKMIIKHYYKKQVTNIDETIDLELKKQSPTVNPIGKEIQTSLFIAKSGTSLPKGYRVFVTYDPSVIRLKSFSKNEAIDSISDYSEVGVISVIYNSVAGGSSNSIPLVWEFVEPMAQIGTNYSIKATLHKPESLSILSAVSKDVAFSPTYNSVNFKLVSQIESGEIVSNTDYSNPTIAYYPSFTGADQRAVSDYTATIDLSNIVNSKGKPSEIKVVDANGWVIDPVKRTATYTIKRENPSTTLPASNSLPAFKVKYVDAKTYTPIIANGNITLTPTNRGANEPLLTSSDYTSDMVKQISIPDGEIFNNGKYAISHNIIPRSNDAWLKDTKINRGKIFSWRVWGISMLDTKAYKLSDHNLDSRLKYVSVKDWTKELDGGTLTTFNSKGVRVQQTVLGKDKKEIKLVNGDNVARIEITAPHGYVPGGIYQSFTVDTVLRDPAKPILSGTVVENMRNQTTAQITTTNNIKYDKTSNANYIVYPFKDIIAVDINQTRPDNTAIIDLTDPKETYTVNITAPSYEKDTLKNPGTPGEFGWQENALTNPTVTTVLPKGFSIKSITPTPEFIKAGGTYTTKVGKNGETIITFNATRIEAEGKPFKVADISGDYTYEVGAPKDGEITQFTGKAYIKQTNPLVSNYKPEGTQSEYAGQASDTTTVGFNLPTIFTSIKSIRNVNSDGTKTAWARNVTTEIGGNIEWDLQILNYTQHDREGTVFLDRLPQAGDYYNDTDENGQKTPRGSQFMPTPKYVIVPEGYKVYGGKAAKDDVVVDGKDMGTISTTPLLVDSNRKAIIPAGVNVLKIVANPGTKLKAGTGVNVIIGANIPNDPALVGKKAVNSHVRKDIEATNYIEANPVTVNVVAPKGSVKLHKVDEAKRPLGGARFELEATDGSERFYGVSGDDGTVRITGINILKDYVLREVAAPSTPTATARWGYKPTSKTWNIPASSFVNATHSFELSEKIVNLPADPPPFGNVQLRKLDGTNTPLEGVSFDLRLGSATGEVVATTSSTGNGTVKFSDIKLDKGDVFYVTETEGTGSLLKPIDPIRVVLKPGETVNLGDKTNPVAVVPFTKLGVRDERLVANEPAESFTSRDGVLLDKTGKHAVFTVTSDKGESYTVTSGNSLELPTDRIYTVVEKTAPDGYTVNTKPYRFRLTKLGQMESITPGEAVADPSQVLFANIETRKDSTAKVLKNDQDGKAVAGAEFSLYKIDPAKAPEPQLTDDNKVATKQTGSDGIAQFTGLQGTYVLKETGTPNGYLANNKNQWLFTADPYNAKDFTYEAINVNQKAKILKVERLYTNLNWTNAENIKRITPGTIITPLNGGVYAVDKPLPNAQFELKSDGLVIENIITGDDGYGNITTKLVHDKTYTLKEITAPKGYRALGEEITFTPEQIALSTHDGTVTITVPNNRIKGRINLIKYATGTTKTVPGATYELRQNGKTVGEPKVTNQSGTLYWDNLELGDYQIVETKTPEGYKLNTTPINITLTEKQQTLSIAATNDADTTRLRILKTDANGKALKGAQFLIEDSHGYLKQLDGFANSWLIDIPDGNYKVTETKAPSGYSLLPEPIEITVAGGNINVTKSIGETKLNTTDNTVELTIKNYKQGELPKFGHGGILGLITGGIMLTLIGALSYRTFGRKEND